MYSPRGATSTDAAARCAALSVESTKPVGATAKRPESAGLRGIGGDGKPWCFLTGKIGLIHFWLTFLYMRVWFWDLYFVHMVLFPVLWVCCSLPDILHSEQRKTPLQGGRNSERRNHHDSTRNRNTDLLCSTVSDTDRSSQQIKQMNVDKKSKKEGGKHYVSMLYNGSTAWNRSGNSLCLQVIIPWKIESAKSVL